MELTVLRQVIEEFIPFNKVLGVSVERLERGHVSLLIPFREELIGDPLKRALHGGVISALADAAGGFAVWSVVDNPHGRVSTVDLRVDYLRPGRPETLIAAASVTRAGARLGWADVRLYHPSAEADPVATGRAVYAIKIPRQHRSE